MRKFILLALTPLLLASPNEDTPGWPLGVPERCCGILNCRPARLEIIEKGESKDVVVVEGKRLVLPPGTAHRSNRSGNWWCFQDILDGCEKEVSERCARCVVEGGRSVGRMRVIPLPAGGRGTHLLLPAGGCAGCHARRPSP